MLNTHKIQIIKKGASKGQYGAWRIRMCKQFKVIRDEEVKECNKELIEQLTEEGKTISCKKGCNYCCFQYISSSIAEGILIVDYLYRNDSILRTFIKNYEKWKESAGTASREITSAWTRSFLSKSNSFVSFEDVKGQYYDLQIPCPFLINSSCSVYAVRPLVCASFYSASPPELCAPTTKEEPDCRKVFPSDDFSVRLADLGLPELFSNQNSMPITVFNLLTKPFGEVIKR